MNASFKQRREGGRYPLQTELCLKNCKKRKPFICRLRALLFGYILFYCVGAFASVSEKNARDFAAWCVGMWQSNQDAKALEPFISDEGRGVIGATGLSVVFWSSEHAGSVDHNLDHLNIDHVFIREPDLDDPMQIKLTDYKSAKCLARPEKIAIVYLSNTNKDIRAVLVMPLVSSRGRTMLCPMVENWPTSPKSEGAEVIPSQKNLSTIPGVEIIKIADDRDCYGFPWPDGDEKSKRTFNTNPQGCTLREIVLYASGQGTWGIGLNLLPSGRFKVNCELLDGESGTVEEKVLNAVANAFQLNIKKEDGYLWNGYRVTAPNPLPDCFKKTKESEGQSVMHGRGDYEGYSLQKMFSEALYGKPVQLKPTNNAARYDVKLQLWPEAYGEMVALQQLGFGIVQAKIPEPTVVIRPRQH